MLRQLPALALSALCHPLVAGAADSFDAAAAFGARQSVAALNLSPDGMNVVWLRPTEGQGSAAYTMSLVGDGKTKVALAVNGKSERLGFCRWVSNERLVCSVYLTMHDPQFGIMDVSRLVATNVDGGNAQLLSRRDNPYTHGWQLGGGAVIDWLPGQDSSVLMTRVYLPDDRIGTRIASTSQGVGVDQVDTRTLTYKQVEPPRKEASDYISDGRGHVRIVGLDTYNHGQNTGIVDYLYHPAGTQELKTLSSYNAVEHAGFRPIAVDPDLNVAYGYKKKDGRIALYSVTLDEARHEELVYANPDVDVANLITIGRQDRVIGVSYLTEFEHAVYFAPDIKTLIESLARALPGNVKPRIVDASVDGTRLLVETSTDTDPGAYFIFDRKSHELQPFLHVRNQLDGVRLATMKPVTYPANDGTSIPGYLTLPPATETARGLPAIVMPHGGPSDRDEWGFNWLVQFFANRGYAVLQPNFRGSSGYGDAWFKEKGFRSWEVAIGDVLAAGHWLVGQGIADPAKLGVVGWSYGGYAALQSAVVEPSFFKGVVAIAPVTDLPGLKAEYRKWSNYDLVSDFVGEGAHVHEGSPAEHADRIRAPVLLFHGSDDRNVSIEQSRLMQARLKAAGAKSELVTWDGLDHQLDDSNARAEMLRKSDAFLRHAFGM